MNVKPLVTVIALFSGTIMLSSVLAKMDVDLTSVDCITYAPDIIQNVSCVVNRTAQRPSSLYMEFAVTQDVKDLKGFYMVTFKLGSKLTNFTANKLDFCQFMLSVQSDYILKVASDELHRTSNFPLECPIKKNKRYYINGLTGYANFIPRYFLEVDFVTDIHLNVKDRKTFRFILNGRIGGRH